jgi:nucleotide-binding universal stress UspA family protein
MLRLLVPVLDSLNAAPAARHAIGEGLRGQRIEVHLLQVRTPFSLHVARWISARDRAAFHRDAAERMLQPLRAELARFHIPCTTHVAVGDRAAIIVDEARRLRVHRIVLGAARDNTLTRFVEDDVIEAVCAAAGVPVDVIAGHAVSRLERIGVPLGFGTALGLLWLGE